MRAQAVKIGIDGTVNRRYSGCNKTQTGDDKMTDFEAQMIAAVKTYAELSGKTAETILVECADYESPSARNVRLIMFAAR